MPLSPSAVVFVTGEEWISIRFMVIGGLEEEGLGRDAALMLEVAKPSRSGDVRLTVIMVAMDTVGSGQPFSVEDADRIDRRRVEKLG